MLNEFLRIVRKCDRRNEWTDEQWLDTLRNCVLRGNYIVKIKDREISAFACWLFLKDLNKIYNQYVENTDGTIAYIQCAYVKENGNGMLRKMIREGVERHPKATHIFFCDDESNNKKFLITTNKWRKK